MVSPSRHAVRLGAVVVALFGVSGATAALFYATHDVAKSDLESRTFFPEEFTLAVPHQPGDIVLEAREGAPLLSDSVAAAPRAHLSLVPHAGPSQSDLDSEPLPVVGTAAAGIDHEPLYRALESGSAPLLSSEIDRLLEAFPEDETALLWQARLASWQGDDLKALAGYDRLLALYPETSLYLREKARMLGWMRSYGEALALYAEAQQRFPAERALAAEARAKAAFYDAHLLTARSAYQEWLALEPDNAEALFDLAQLHAGARRYGPARELFEELRDRYPAHREARHALSRLERLAERPFLQGGAAYFRSRSGERLADLDYTLFSSRAGVPLGESARIDVDIENRFYSFASSPFSPWSTRGSIGLDYYGLQDVALAARLGATFRSDGLESSPYAALWLSLRPTDLVGLGFSYRHDEMIENAATFRDGIEQDRFEGTLRLLASRRWQAGVDAAWANYSDGNARYAYGVDLRTHLSYEPDRFSLFWRWDNYGYRRELDDYFTPALFRTNRIGVEWRHLFAGSQLYWGGRRSGLMLRYSLNLEPRSSRSHTFDAALERDWSDSFSSALHYYRSWNEEGGIYDADRVAADLFWYF